MVRQLLYFLMLVFAMSEIVSLRAASLNQTECLFQIDINGELRSLVFVSDVKLNPDLEANLLQRARNLISLKQIVQARLLLEYLANHDSPNGTYYLAQTYDDGFLIALNIVGGVKGDKALALKWYQKALALGVQEAARRIDYLNK